MRPFGTIALASPSQRGRRAWQRLSPQPHSRPATGTCGSTARGQLIKPSASSEILARCPLGKRLEPTDRLPDTLARVVIAPPPVLLSN